jgi:hypothetical protein
VFPGTVLLDATPSIGNGASGSGAQLGNVNGTATLAFTGLGIGTVGTITNDIQSKGELDMPGYSPVYGNQGSGTTEEYTDATNPWTNYTENGTIGQAAIGVQIWELGNSISVIENGPPAKGQYNDPSQDPGAALSDCYSNATVASQPGN